MTTFLAIIAAMAALPGSVVAVSFDLLPERVDLFGFVLQGAGLGALTATALAVIRKAKSTSAPAGSNSATATAPARRSACSCSSLGSTGILSAKARSNWIPPLGGAIVLIVLGVLAGLGDGSALAIHGALFAGIVTAAVLFALTDRGKRSPHP